MIQCPICQVLNEDSALFCAECGQRFNLSQGNQGSHGAPSQDQTLPPQDVEERPKNVKLRSPMLGSADDDEGYDKPQMGRLRGNPTSKSEEQTSTGKKHLRSPLLGGGDDDGDDYDDSESRSPRGKKRTQEPSDSSTTTGRKKKLRSPLLGEDDDDDDSDDDMAETGQRPGKRRLSSPLLGQDTTGGFDDEDRPKRSPRPAPHGESHPPKHHHSGLRSPLLGGEDGVDDDYGDEPERPRRSNQGQQPGSKPKLRSALLGGGDFDEDYDDDWDEDDEDNPNVLRSPLLAAKRKRKPTDAQAAPQANVFAQTQDAPPGVQVHKQPDPQHSPMPPAHAVQNWVEHQPQQSPVAAPVAQPTPMPLPVSPPVQSFPGPSEPQPPWQGGTQGPPLVGGPVFSQPQPGQAPIPGPPLPAEPGLPNTPPWQGAPVPVPEPPRSLLDPALPNTAAKEVRIIDDNEEFQLDIPDPSRNFAPQSQPLPAVPPAPPPVKETVQPHNELDSIFPKDDSASQDNKGPAEGGGRERRRIERRRGGSDRRFSSLLDEKSSSPAPIDDDDDDFMPSRPPASANKGLAGMMLVVGALALVVKIGYFIYVAGLWDLSKMPEFIGEQFFSGLALVGLIVLALSCMKK